MRARIAIWSLSAAGVVVAAALVALLPAGCASVLHPFAYRSGVSSAERSIATGEPYLVVIGLPRHDVGVLDVATGLPRFSRGCEWSPAADAEMEGHNQTILAALADGRLAAWVLKHKVTTRDAVARRFEVESGVPLAVGADPITAPGGRFAIEAAPRDNQGDMSPYIFVLDRTSGTRRELQWLNPGTRMLFADDGTTLLVRDEKFREFVVFDLPRRLDLQRFPDPDRGW